jgi:hypothetical protein
MQRSVPGLKPLIEERLMCDLLAAAPEEDRKTATGAGQGCR